MRRALVRTPVAQRLLTPIASLNGSASFIRMSQANYAGVISSPSLLSLSRCSSSHMLPMHVRMLSTTAATDKTDSSTTAAQKPTPVKRTAASIRLKKKQKKKLLAAKAAAAAAKHLQETEQLQQALTTSETTPLAEEAVSLSEEQAATEVFSASTTTHSVIEPTTTTTTTTTTTNAVTTALSTDKIIMTLEEIRTLQKTLPSVEEIGSLVEKLRVESFQKGHHLFDLYRNYGNPFLDENFLVPGVVACCEAKNPAQGIQIVRDMLNQGRKVEESTFQALLETCEITSAATEVIELWELMERAGFLPTLKEYNKFLDICYRRQYLDGAIKVLKQLRLLRPISVNTYMHWLLRSSIVWRADAFFEILMEMRLAGVEPEIPSLTSLENGRKDPALTVMEGVRAVGLDPCFAMSAVFGSMQAKIYQNGPSVESSIPQEINDATMEKFGPLKPIHLKWKTKPIPQLLETQAAGLILREETFRRLEREQVHRIHEMLEMLPIDANMTVNLRKQLQRMSLIVNTQRVRESERELLDQYQNEKKSLIELSMLYKYPPVSLMRIILKARGLGTLQIKKALANPSYYLSERDQRQLRRAQEYDSVHKSDPFIGAPSYNADSLEVTIAQFLRAKGIRLKTEEELAQEQETKYGRRVLSPDILLLDPVIINGVPIRWIDAKNYYGAHIVSKRLISKQLASYVDEFGPGAIVFGMGFSDMFHVPGVLCLDTTPFPKGGKDLMKMKTKSFFYSIFNVFRWKKHLGSELTKYYPPAPTPTPAPAPAPTPTVVDSEKMSTSNPTKTIE